MRKKRIRYVILLIVLIAGLIFGALYRVFLDTVFGNAPILLILCFASLVIAVHIVIFVIWLKDCKRKACQKTAVKSTPEESIEEIEEKTL